MYWHLICCTVMQKHWYNRWFLSTKADTFMSFFSPRKRNNWPEGPPTAELIIKRDLSILSISKMCTFNYMPSLHNYWFSRIGRHSLNMANGNDVIWVSGAETILILYQIMWFIFRCWFSKNTNELFFSLSIFSNFSCSEYSRPSSSFHQICSK